MAYGNPRWAGKQNTTCPVLGRLWEVYGEATGNHPTHRACKIFLIFHRAVWPVQVYNRLFKLARAQLRSKLNQ